MTFPIVLSSPSSVAVPTFQRIKVARRCGFASERLSKKVARVRWKTTRPSTQSGLSFIRLTVVALAAITLAGCGGQPDEQRVRSTVNQFTVDVGQGDYGRACTLTTGQQRTAICGLAAAGNLTQAECADVSPNSVAGQACTANQNTTQALASFTSLTISKVVISGNQATVAFNGSSEVMTLAKRNGTWLISSA